jgi:aryl-alcohol dehydrogenase-like predicted oxidoreductase
MARVPHASGLLEGRYTRETSFGADDHRYFRVNTDERKRAWLEDGLKKLERLAFLTAGRSVAQAAIRFILASSCFACVLPNIYREEQLATYAAVSDFDGFSQGELAEIAEQFRQGFGVP